MKNEVLRVRNGNMSTNTYLIGNEIDGCYVIDPSDNYSLIKNKINDKYGNKVKAILLTHGHLDHIGSVDRLVNDYNCEVYINDLDKYLIDGSLRSYPNMLQEFNIIINSSTKDAYFIPDKNITVLETPGHTPGSVCYLFNEENVIFTGDTLFAGGVGRCDLPGGRAVELRKSLRVFFDLNDNLRVLPGHEGESTLKNEKLYNYYLKRI